MELATYSRRSLLPVAVGLAAVNPIEIVV